MFMSGIRGLRAAFAAIAALVRGTSKTSGQRTARPRAIRKAAVVLALATALAGVFTAVAITEAAVTLPALAGHWAMNEGSGSTTADSSPNGNTATLGAGASWTTGPGGAPAIALNGNSTGIVSFAKPVVNTAQSMTVSAWVKFSATTGYQTIASIDGSAVANGSTVSGFFLQLNASTGTLLFLRYTSNNSNGTAVLANSGVRPVAGTWYHVVGVDDVSAGQLQIYVNGTEDGTASYSSAWQATGTLAIGRGEYDGASTNYFDGAVDDVQAYQAALSTAQVDALNGTPVALTTAI